MKAVYAAVDGYLFDGNETLASLIAEDSIQGANLLTTPSNASLWTAGNSAVITQQDNQTIKLTNGGAYSGYGYRSITTEVGNYYLFRAYVNVGTTPIARIFAGTNSANASYGITTTTTNKVVELIFKAVGTTTYIDISNSDTTTGVYSYWSNIEVIKLNHYGVDETTDYIINGGWNNNTDNWDVDQNSGTAVISSSSGRLLIDNNSSATYGRAYQAVPVEAGKAYKLKVDVIATDTEALLRIADGGLTTGSALAEASRSDAGELEVNFVAPDTSINVVVQNNSATTTDTTTFDNCTLTESGNLVSNHNFEIDAVWTKGTGDSIAGGVLTHTGAPAGRTRQDVAINKGETWVFTMKINSNSGEARFDVYDGSTWIQVNNNITTTGTFHITFTADKYYSQLGLLREDGDVEIDNVTARRAYPVLDANGNALEVYGEIVEVPVNYNTTTVALANFSTDNFLKMPYSSDLDPGTGDLSISAWVKMRGDGTSQIIAWRDSPSTAQNFALYIDGSGNVRMRVDDNTTTREAISVTAVTEGAWVFACGTYDQSAGTVTVYVNGDFSNDTTGTALLTLSNTTASLGVGATPLTTPTSTNDGQIAGLKIDVGNAWTAQKVRNIDESEKVLFNQNEIYSINGDDLTLAVKIRNSHEGIDSDVNTNESYNHNREHIVHWTKQTYDVSTVPVPFAEKNKLRKFAKSIVGQSFTLSERSFEYGADNEMVVYCETPNISIPREPNANDLYTCSFKVVEK